MPDNQTEFPNDLADMVAWIDAHTVACDRVLEIGAGDGAVVDALAARYDILGVDPGAEPRPRVLATTFEDLDAEPFATVFASVSLHHLHDLDAAAAALRRLTRPGSVVLVREFDRTRLEEHEATLRWWWHQRCARVIGDGGEPDNYAGFVEQWRHHMIEHVHPWVLVESMLRAADLEPLEGFDCAYLFRWGLTEDVRPIEDRLIETGAIRAVGVRWAGVRRASLSR
jgi:SAM-dependent methyltransferase